MNNKKTKFKIGEHVVNSTLLVTTGVLAVVAMVNTNADDDIAFSKAEIVQNQCMEEYLQRKDMRIAQALDVRRFIGAKTNAEKAAEKHCKPNNTKP